jgi:shikimate dehydrogenase
MESLPAGAAVVDLVYEPRRTSVLERAEKRGLTIVDGLGMLLHQGAIAFEMWTGFEAPIGIMRSALND